MTPISNWLRGLKVSSIDSGFTSTIPTVTEPFADGVHPVLNGAETLEIIFFGAGSDNTAFDARIIGWNKTGEANPLWIPVSIVEATVTRCAVVGIAGTIAINTDRFADTIVINKGVGVAYTVTADAEPSLLVVDISGCEKWQFIGNLTAGTNMNLMYRTY